MEGRWNSVGVSPASVGVTAAQRVIVWHVFNGCMIVFAGAVRKNRFHSHWQTVDNEKWVSSEERKPTRADADAQECVIARTKAGDIRMAGWHRFANERDLTDWQRPPKPPDNYRKLRKKY